MTTHLSKEKTMHKHPRSKHGKIFTDKETEHEANFILVEIQDPETKGKSKKYYEPRRKEEMSTSSITPTSRNKPYKFAIPLGSTICPYIRKLIEIGSGVYDGTCSLTKRTCLKHKAYCEEEDPGCLPYNIIWHPQTGQEAEFVRTASVKDLTTYIQKQTR